jgi:hypothetical protein
MKTTEPPRGGAPAGRGWLVRLMAAAWVLFRRPPTPPALTPAPPVVIDDPPPVLPEPGSAADVLGALEDKKREVDWRLRLLEDQRAVERGGYAG